MTDSYKHELLFVLRCFCFSQFFFRHTKPHTVTSPSLPASTTRSPTRTSRTPFPLSHYVRTGPSHVGTGVFARRRMRADIVIGEIHGEIFSESPEDPSYCMELPSEKVLEPVALCDSSTIVAIPTAKSFIGRLMTPSCRRIVCGYKRFASSNLAKN